MRYYVISMKTKWVENTEYNFLVSHEMNGFVFVFVAL